MCELEITCLDDIAEEKIKWLWEPYIPAGKITIIQGDPAEGKTTMVLDLIARLTSGRPLPENNNNLTAINAIYQTAEDGIADTIKPRLLAAGANCKNVWTISEMLVPLSFADDRIERAIIKTQAKILVLDPLQAYLGSHIDMNRANDVRPAFTALSNVAQKHDCAIVIISHLNKTQNTKMAYRGIGSIDIRAAARSVLVVSRIAGTDDRIVTHDKSSLAQNGKTLKFTINSGALEWRGEVVKNTKCESVTKSSKIIDLLIEWLKDGPVSTAEILKKAQDQNIAESTVNAAKAKLHIMSKKIGATWYMVLENEGCKAV